MKHTYIKENHENMKESIETIVKAIDEKKGNNILVFDYHELNPFIDHVIITSASNQRQVFAIADNIIDCAHEAGIHTCRMEGNKDSRWILVDLDTIVVHVFLDEEREIYRLEQLYADLPQRIVKQ